jgi:nitrite reductase/ring-hydroxylating ferredoxin subunit/uncharacterized membrane protein
MQLLERLLDRISAASGLDATSGPLAEQVQRATASTPVKNALSGSWLGHQVHPLLTDLPIGAWVSAGVLDLVGGPGSRPAAQRLAGLGILAAVPAAATGASDWSESYGPEQRVGLVHAATNTVALACWTASWRARRHGHHGRGRVFGLLGLGAVSAGGYLGGHLVFRQAVGVDRTATEHRPSDWVDVAGLDELAEGMPARAVAGGVPVVLVRHGHGVDALSATCTHAGGPLDEGTVADGCVRCPWHGSHFRLVDGDVVRGPASSPQPSWEAKVEAGRVSVRFAASAH